MAEQASASGIITDDTGERHIPESRRADGTTRKAIKIRPGYRPPEDVEVYKNRTAEWFRQRGKGPPPGSESLKADEPAPTSAASHKNAKRREARKKARAATQEEDENAQEREGRVEEVEARTEDVDPEVEKEKKVRNLRKKLKQARHLKDQDGSGTSLLPEQIVKITKISELIRELEALGIDDKGDGSEETVYAN